MSAHVKSLQVFTLIALVAGSALGRPAGERLQSVDESGYVDRVGAGNDTGPRKALQDTVWIADWSFDDVGVSVASGIYFYRLVSADFEDTRKMVVVR